jgi:hypothetical protein
MYNIFLLPEDLREKQRARRQLAVKDTKSNSWYTEVKSLLWKYDLLRFSRKPFCSSQSTLFPLRHEFKRVFRTLQYILLSTDIKGA